MSETIIEFLSGTPGATVWGFSAMGIVILTWLVVQFFTFNKLVVKLMTFLLIVMLLGVLSWTTILNFHKTENNELNNIPSARTNIFVIEKLRVDSAQANSDTDLVGWIHCGDYDSSKNRWIFKYVSVLGEPIKLKDTDILMSLLLLGSTLCHIHEGNIISLPGIGS